MTYLKKHFYLLTGFGLLVTGWIYSLSQYEIMKYYPRIDQTVEIEWINQSLPFIGGITFTLIIIGLLRYLGNIHEDFTVNLESEKEDLAELTESIREGINEAETVQSELRDLYAAIEHENEQLQNTFGQYHDLASWIESERSRKELLKELSQSYHQGEMGRVDDLIYKHLEHHLGDEERVEIDA